MTHLGVIKSNSTYPVGDTVIEGMALRRGLDINGEATKDSLLSEEYKLTEADFLIWISNAPNVTEGGVSFDILYSTRNAMKAQAQAIYDEFEDVSDSTEDVSFGYKGDSI